MILPHYESGKSEESNSLISEKTVDNDDSGILLLSNDLMRIKTSRKQIALDISNRSEKILPNCSALVGPLVAARLLAQAGSLTSLARKPASAVQILGARNAFFMHRITGSPPPKHGCIYEHKRVHSAPRKVRGKISRTLAACLAIAARLDCYRGTLDADFQDRAKQRIERAGGRR
jgi:nucleolar protein 56